MNFYSNVLEGKQQRRAVILHARKLTFKTLLHLLKTSFVDSYQ